MTYQEIRLSKEDSICFLTLNNPRKINALSQRMIQELIDALTQIAIDEAVKWSLLQRRANTFARGMICLKWWIRVPRNLKSFLTNVPG